MIEVKETKEILTAVDVEERLYHAFMVYRFLPPVKPQGYFNVFLNIHPEQLDPEEIKPAIYGHNYDLAMEVCDQWWPLLLQFNDPELLELIKYRCGAPIIKNGREVYGWSRIRPWKAVAAEFRCHRNTAKNKWNDICKFILDAVKSGKLCLIVQKSA